MSSPAPGAFGDGVSVCDGDCVTGNDGAGMKTAGCFFQAFGS